MTIRTWSRVDFITCIVLIEMVGYDCFIIFQYYLLNIKVLKFYENFEIMIFFFENFQQKKINFIILKFFENFLIL
jgi:hypothetical protein